VNTELRELLSYLLLDYLKAADERLLRKLEPRLGQRIFARAPWSVALAPVKGEGPDLGAQAAIEALGAHRDWLRQPAVEDPRCRKRLWDVLSLVGVDARCETFGSLRLSPPPAVIARARQRCSDRDVKAIAHQRRLASDARLVEPARSENEDPALFALFGILDGKIKRAQEILRPIQQARRQPIMLHQAEPIECGSMAGVLVRRQHPKPVEHACLVVGLAPKQLGLQAVAFRFVVTAAPGFPKLIVSDEPVADSEELFRRLRYCPD